MGSWRQATQLNGEPAYINLDNVSAIYKDQGHTVVYGVGISSPLQIKEDPMDFMKGPKLFPYA